MGPVMAPGLAVGGPVRLRALRWIAALLAAWCGWQPLQAALPQEDVAVKAAFLNRFTGFVEWPSRSLAPDEPITVATLGDEQVAAELERIVAERRGRRPVTVRRVTTPRAAAGAHLLYVGANAPVREVIAQAPPGPLLIVTDDPAGHPPGSAINFSREQGQVRFSASPAAAEARGLRLSASLLSVARRLDPGGR